MHFRIDLGDVAQAVIHVALEFDRSPDARGESELFLPVWTPGSYLVREYSRQLRDIFICDAVSGAPISWTKVAKNRIRITEGGMRVQLRYTVYAHELTVRTSHVSDDFAFWNGSCVLLWPVGAEGDAARVTVSLPEGWSLFCGRPTSVQDSEVSFEFADLDEAVDTPCLAGDPDVLHFDVLGKPHTVACAGLDGIEIPERFVSDTQAVIEAAAAVFGGTLPFSDYTFLALFDDRSRGGLEHKNSTTLLAPRTTFQPGKPYEDFMGLVAHEYFHVWNVKRMRPVELWEFDYECENYTELLWVAEGFTAYYDDLICQRVGIVSPSRYLEILAGHVTNYRGMPGRFAQTLSEASFDAWIRLYRPDENTRNSTQNYYANGAIAAFVLDSRIRSASDGAHCLDDAVKALYQSTYEAGRGYTHEDVVRVISSAAGEDLSGLIHSLTRESLDPDMSAALLPFGLELCDKSDGKLFMGVQFQAGSLRVASVTRNMPAWEAGLAPGDELLGMGELRVTSANWSMVFAELAEAEESLEVLVSRRGRLLRISVTPITNPNPGCSIRSVSSPDESQLQQRRAWLGTDSIR